MTSEDASVDVLPQTASESSLADRLRRDIQARIDEIEPAVREHERLTRALEGLNAAINPHAKQYRRRGRPKGSGFRGKQALDAVNREPGLSATDIANRIGVHPNYAYRILPQLEDEGYVAKRGSKWFPTGKVMTSSTTAPPNHNTTLVERSAHDQTD